MEMKIEVHGDLYDDADSLKIFVNAKELHSAICDARSLIRNRLKWDEELSNDEEQFLEKINDALRVDELF